MIYFGDFKVFVQNLQTVVANAIKQSNYYVEDFAVKLTTKIIAWFTLGVKI